MWQTLLDKNKDELREMKFSKRAIRKFALLRRIKFDKKIVIFLQKCEIIDYIQLSIRFSNVYTTFENFKDRIEGKE